MAKGKVDPHRLPKDDWRDVDPSKNKPKKQIHLPVSVSFEHFQYGGNFCFQACNGEQLASAVDCLHKLTTIPWSDVIKTGSKKRGQKVGLGHTTYDDDTLAGVKRPASISPEIKIAGVRATQEFRIFGALNDHVFYLLWFDPHHRIVPSD